jgi:anti-sigma B factor antagonist
MSKETLTITTLPSERPGQSVIKLDGALTITTVFEFQDATRAAKSAVVILDFSGVPYVDSAGMGAIVRAHVSCSNDKRRLILAGVPDRVLILLRLTGVDKVLVRFPTVQEAQSSLEAAPA